MKNNGYKLREKSSAVKSTWAYVSKSGVVWAKVTVRTKVKRSKRGVKNKKIKKGMKQKEQKTLNRKRKRNQHKKSHSLTIFMRILKVSEKKRTIVRLIRLISNFKISPSSTILIMTKEMSLWSDKISVLLMNKISGKISPM